MFWIICALLTLAILAIVLTPLLRPDDTDQEEDPQVALYKAQLAEVERDVARDVLAAEEAERAKTEIARRLLAATKRTHQARQGPAPKAIAVATSIAVLLTAGGTYLAIGSPGEPDLPLQTRIALGNEARANRPSQAAFEAAAPNLTLEDVPADYLASIEELRVLVPSQGDDLNGWQLLAHHEAQLRNYAAAAKAQSEVLKIKGIQISEADLVRYVDLLVAAANGFVSPEAEDAARAILNFNPESIPARYYMGALFDQTDRPDRAFQLWRAILESGAPESFHVAMARRQIEGAAFRAGISYTPPEANQLSMEQMLMAEDLDADAQGEMIAGMVNSLSDRLATQGGSVSEWARLIVAYGVLGQVEDSKAVLAEARDVFGASEEALAVLADAEMRAGLIE